MGFVDQQHRDLFLLDHFQDKISRRPDQNRQDSCVVVIVGNQDNKGGSPTFSIKDQLKSEGYQWQTTGIKGWVKTFPAKGFDVSLLKKEVWASKADGIEVKISSEQEVVQEKYLINSGQWVRA